MNSVDSAGSMTHMQVITRKGTNTDERSAFLVTDEPCPLYRGGPAVMCWDRQADQIIGYFTPRQIRWLRDHVSTFRDAVDLHRGWAALERRLADTALTAEIIQDDRHHGSVGAPLSPEVPAWSIAGHQTEPVVFGHMLAYADLVVDSLPTTGGVVVLPDARAVWAWIWSLYQCGMHLAFRLGLTWAPTYTQIHTHTTTDRAERSFLKVRAWLMTVIGTLIDVADLPYPTLGAHALDPKRQTTIRGERHHGPTAGTQQ